MSAVHCESCGLDYNGEAGKGCPNNNCPEHYVEPAPTTEAELLDDEYEKPSRKRRDR